MLPRPVHRGFADIIPGSLHSKSKFLPNHLGTQRLRVVDVFDTSPRHLTETSRINTVTFIFLTVLVRPRRLVRNHAAQISTSLTVHTNKYIVGAYLGT